MHKGNEVLGYNGYIIGGKVRIVWEAVGVCSQGK
jgi:hypothetical protein